MEAKTITGTIYIVASRPDAEPTLSADSMEEYGWITLGTHEITLDVPEVDIRSQFVAVLRKQAALMTADHHVALGDIESQIQSLLAIEHDAE